MSTTNNNSPFDNNSILISIKDAAELLDVSQRTVTRMIEAKELKSVLVLGSRKLYKAEIFEYLDKRTE